ncbi:MAG: hypothetical protein Q4P14_00820 [Methanobacteriaceae archaeon]|nr:hypothetical protein [Methanobacteriaceae archaeon]
MIETILLLAGLVVDTFILTSVNGLSVKENIKSYLGIETTFSIIGFLIGSFILIYIPTITFKLICGLIIIVIQLIDVFINIEFPETVNALLLGSDSLVVFATLEWIYIPMLFVVEACAIVLGSYIGPKIMVYVPKFVQEYASNIVMVIIGLTLILPFLVSHGMMLI